MSTSQFDLGSSSVETSPSVILGHVKLTVKAKQHTVLCLTQVWMFPGLHLALNHTVPTRDIKS